jgi:hypothetical protein
VEAVADSLGTIKVSVANSVPAGTELGETGTCADAESGAEIARAIPEINAKAKLFFNWTPWWIRCEI